MILGEGKSGHVKILRIIIEGGFKRWRNFIITPRGAVSEGYAVSEYLLLSVAFCLTGLLALSSCDLEFWEDDDEAMKWKMEAMEMRGFFTSVLTTTDGTTVCSITKTLM